MEKIPSLEEKIGQLIVAGFHGTSPDDPSVKKFMAQVGQGKIGGTILFRYNIETPAQVKELTGALQGAVTGLPLFVFVDQEGGKVQRLEPGKGFENFLSAKAVAQTLSREEALGYYQAMGKVLGEAGFNFDFAPCVDLDGDPPCPVIGGIERSYSRDAEQVASFAGAMMAGLGQEKIFNCLKHYPGHGRALGDTHTGLVDITATWSEEELAPYKALIQKGGADGVMTAHVIHGKEDPDTPASFSKKWMRRLREDLGFTGLVIPDDLHMGAILHRYSLEEIVVRGLNAGLDFLLFSNNPLAAQAQGIRHDEHSSLSGGAGVPDEDLADKIISIVLAAVSKGSLSMDRIDQAYGRVTALKNKLVSSGSVPGQGKAGQPAQDQDQP